MHLRRTRKSPRPWRPAGPVGRGHGEKGRSSLRIMSRSPRGRPWSPAGQPNTEDSSRGDAPEGPGARAAGSPGPPTRPWVRPRRFPAQGCCLGLGTPSDVTRGVLPRSRVPHLTPAGAGSREFPEGQRLASRSTQSPVPRPPGPQATSGRHRASSGRLQGQVSPSFSGQFGPWPLAFESGCPAFLMEEPLLLQFREVSNFLASFNQV